MINKKTIVLHSGGLDSTVCLLQAIETNKEVISLGIDYNQKNIIENQYALDQCEKYGVERKIIKVEWDRPLKTVSINNPISEIKGHASQYFLEGRNIVFLALACAESAGISAEEVWMGVSGIDSPNYPDCSLKFIESFRKMLEYGYPLGPRIITPLINKTKLEIVRKAHKLGIKKEDTWSCYNPVFSRNKTEPCDECNACILNNYAWENFQEK